MGVVKPMTKFNQRYSVKVDFAPSIVLNEGIEFWLANQITNDPG